MPLESPIVTFTILIATILIVPPLFERLRLPGLIGLMIAGVVLGQSGLKLLDNQSETVKLLSEVGKVYLMFVAGLEIDLEQFRKTRNRSMGFGLLTFLVPLITGITIGQVFGFNWNASLLIGSLLASHTLLAYPIVSRLGVVNNEAVTVTIGATIFTDTGALLVLAICVGIHQGEFTAFSLATLLLGLAIYSATVLFGFDWAGKAFFRRSGDQEGKQFLFILLALFVASVGAQIIGVEKIVGAFLAGLAVNDVLGRSPSREKVEFVGSVLFIPCFFIDMGLLIDIPAFIKTLSSVGLTIAIVGGLIGSKFVAAFIAKLFYRYTQNELLMMWSLSLPQVAATLAATLVAYQTINPAGERLVNENILNSVIVLMVVTSVMGPLITARVASLLPLAQPSTEQESPSIWWEGQTCDLATRSQIPFTIIVPLYNPQTQRYMIELAALLARHGSGLIVPLAIARSHIHMDNPQLEQILTQSQTLLATASSIAQEFGITALPKVRIDDDIALGISRASREENASLIVMGWSRTFGLRARLFGNVIDSVFWSSHCPVAVTRLLCSPTSLERILVPVESLSQQTLRTIQFAQLLATTAQASVTLLYICNRRVPTAQIAQFEAQLFDITANSTVKIQTILQDDVVRSIVQAAKNFDLVILHAVRQRTTAGFAVSNVTTQAIKELTGSMIILGEPHS